MDIIKKIAKAHGVSTKEVYEEMQKAIRVGRESTDPSVRAMWDRLFPNGKEPTVEEFIRTLTHEVKTKRGS